MQYLYLLVPTVLAFLITAVTIPYIKVLALRLGAVDNPGGRRVHKKPTPRMGGLAIAASFFLVLAFFVLAFPDFLTLRGADLMGLNTKFLGLVLGSLTILAVGAYDDIKGMNPATKFALQLAAIAIVMLSGIRVDTLGNPAGDSLINLGDFGYLVVPIWLLFMTNSVNWFDGVDGLSGGLSVIALIVIGILSLQPEINQSEIAFLSFILAGSALGFMPYNWHPAKIFLGDSGSMFLGFTIGVLAIISGAKLATAALVLGLPLIDAVWVIVRRLANRKPVWLADDMHLHHRFLRAGITPPMIAIINYLIAITLGIIALESGTTVKLRVIAALPLIIGFLVGVLFAYSRNKDEKQKN